MVKPRLMMDKLVTCPKQPERAVVGNHKYLSRKGDMTMGVAIVKFITVDENGVQKEYTPDKLKNESQFFVSVEKKGNDGELGVYIAGWGNDKSRMIAASSLLRGVENPCALLGLTILEDGLGVEKSEVQSEEKISMEKGVIN